MKTHLFPIGTGNWFNRAVAANSTTTKGGSFYYVDEMQPLDAPDILPAGSTVWADGPAQLIALRIPSDSLVV